MQGFNPPAGAFSPERTDVGHLGASRVKEHFGATGGDASQLHPNAQEAAMGTAGGQLISDAEALPLLRDWVETFWNCRDEGQARTIATRVLDPAAKLHGFAAPYYSSSSSMGQGGTTSGMTRGIDEAMAYWREVRSAFPDLRVTLHKTQPLAKGRRYLSRYHISGTHSGPGLGLGTPTGRPVTAGGMAMHKFGKLGSGRERLLVKEWNYCDDLGLVMQLGLAKLPGGASAGVGQPQQVPLGLANPLSTLPGTTAGNLK